MRRDITISKKKNASISNASQQKKLSSEERCLMLRWYIDDVRMEQLHVIQIRKSNKSKSFWIVEMRLMKVHHER